MMINIPEGLDISPEDMKRKEIEALSTFEIDEEEGKLKLMSIDGVPVPEEEDMEEEDMGEGESEGEGEGMPEGGMGKGMMERKGQPMPSKEETIGEFVRGQLAKRGKK